MVSSGKTPTVYAYPVLESLNAAEITTEHLLKVLNPIWKTKSETASRVRNRIEVVLDAAKAKGLREGSLAGTSGQTLASPLQGEGSRAPPCIALDRMPVFMKRLSAMEGLGYKAMQLTILTACRTNEVLGATWDEMDLQKQVWKIPAHRMKAAKEHRVPLSNAAIDLLKSLNRVKGNPYVFPGARENRPLSNMAMLMGLRRMERTDLTMHGFRSTFRDWAAESTQYPREVCEQALAHVRQDKAEGAYFRGDLFEKRQAMVSEWAAFMAVVTDNILVTVSEAN